MDKASDTQDTFKSRKRGWNYGFIAAGILCGLVAFYVVDGWRSGLIFGLGGLCFAVSKYLSYMEDAGPD